MTVIITEKDIPLVDMDVVTSYRLVAPDNIDISSMSFPVPAHQIADGGSELLVEVSDPHDLETLQRVHAAFNARWKYTVNKI